MIAFEFVTKMFNPGLPNARIGVSDLSLEFGAGEFVVIIGANGSGKSTLLNLVSGSLLASQGKVRIGDEDVTRLPEYKRSRWMARVFQDPLKGTAPALSILDNFRLAALRTSPKGPVIGNTAAFKAKVATEVATLNMGLEDRLNLQMGTLSGGQRQALTLLMCAMDDLDILLLDEPAAALDPASAELVMGIADRLIRERNLTAVLVTHNLRDVFRYGNRLLFMKGGKVVRDIDRDARQSIEESTLYSWFLDAEN